MIFYNFPLSKVEETMAGHYSDEEEGDILHIDEYSPSVPGVALEEEGAKIGRIMESKWDNNIEYNNRNIRENEKNALPKEYRYPRIHRTNAEEWRLEVERVAPSLKMTVKTDGR